MNKWWKATSSDHTLPKVSEKELTLTIHTRMVIMKRSSELDLGNGISHLQTKFGTSSMHT